MPSSRAAATSASTSSSVPSSGWTAVWPPSLVADRPRAAGVVGAGDERVVAALAVREADRVDRRQVEHVEAELGQPRQLLAARRRGRPTSAGTARTRRRSGRGRGSTSTLELARRACRSVRSGIGASTRREVGDRAPAADRRRRPRARRRRGERRALAAAPRSCAAASRSTSTPSDSSPPRSSWPASSLRSTSSRQEAKRSAQASTVQRQRPSGPSTRERALPAHAVLVGVDRRAAAPRAICGRAGRAAARDGPQDVVPVAEDVGADRRPRRRASA